MLNMLNNTNALCKDCVYAELYKEYELEVNNVYSCGLTDAKCVKSTSYGARLKQLGLKVGDLVVYTFNEYGVLKNCAGLVNEIHEPNAKVSIIRLTSPRKYCCRGWFSEHSITRVETEESIMRRFKSITPEMIATARLGNALKVYDAYVNSRKPTLKVGDIVFCKFKKKDYHYTGAIRNKMWKREYFYEWLPTLILDISDSGKLLVINNSEDRHYLTVRVNRDRVVKKLGKYTNDKCWPSPLKLAGAMHRLKELTERYNAEK